jgi:cell division septation protein DedD
MAKQKEGDFEVLLGNTQLMSLFVIVVVLLAVFFTMGYVLGKHTGTEATVSSPQKEAVASESRIPAASGAVVDTTTPAQPNKAPEPEQAASSSRAENQPGAAPAQPQSSPPASRDDLREPAAGQTFLQVVAGRRSDAEVVASVLRKKGFAALLAPGPVPEVFRVLVGPLQDSAAITSTRANLQKAGFDRTLVRRY